MRICGIDPGAKGAFCVLDSKDPAYLAFQDVHRSSIYELGNWLFRQKIDLFIIEDVHSLYGMSAKSNFNFGKNIGIMIALTEIICKGTPAKKVPPKMWQKWHGITSKGKAIKEEVALKAQQLYPAANLYGARKGLLDGRSDAVMIAHYGLYAFA